MALEAERTVEGIDADQETIVERRAVHDAAADRIAVRARAHHRRLHAPTRSFGGNDAGAGDDGF
jgi:hypothetical protein